MLIVNCIILLCVYPLLADNACLVKVTSSIYTYAIQTMSDPQVLHGLQAVDQVMHKPGKE